MPNNSAARSEIDIGSVLGGRYRIDAVLGSGGMGCVYRAEHLGIGRPVAIKVLHTEVGQNREAAQRFQREALASGRLDHPNIVGVTDFGVLGDGSCFLVMELLEGQSLAARIDLERRIHWRDALGIMDGVLRGLVHAHARGVVHRDIKPDNVFLSVKDGDLVVKLLDFGIAKLFMGDASDPATTRAGLTMGTPAYLSPEQALGGQITPASDLYSATVVLFEMLTGRAPFEEDGAIAIMTAHVSKRAPSISDLAPDLVLPERLPAIIQRGLQKAVVDRMSSAVEYLELLDEVRVWSDRSQAISEPVAVPREHDAQFASGPINVTEGARAVPRARSIADSEPLPRKWIAVGAIVLGCGGLLAIIAATSGSESTKHDAKPEPSSAPQLSLPMAPLEPRLDLTLDRELMLKAALHDLETGRTCEERRKVIAKLVELGDTRAVPDLKAARYRMRGGLLGIGQDNTNACLRRDADAAIRTLSKPPGGR